MEGLKNLIKKRKQSTNAVNSGYLTRREIYENVKSNENENLNKRSKGISLSLSNEGEVKSIESKKVCADKPKLTIKEIYVHLRNLKKPIR